MSRPLRVLLVEDSDDDMLLLLRELRHGGYDPRYSRVETAGAMQAALAEQSWEVIIADYSLPHFNAPAALALLQASGLDLPFIIVSGTVGEEVAVAAMKAGAHDYLVKGQLARLVPVIERELREAEGRRERRQVAQALAERENYFRALIEHAPDGIALLNAGGILRYVSPSTHRILGYTSEELVGRDPIEWLHPDDHEAMLGLFAETFQKPGEIFNAQYRVQHKDGSWRWLEVTINNWLAEPSVQGIVLNYHDITERRQAEEELQQTTAELRFVNDLVAQTTQPIAVGDFQGRIIRFNQAYEQLTGYSREELLQMTYQQLTPERWYDTEVQQVAHLMATEQTVRYEKEYRRKDGTLVPIEAVIDIYRDETGQPKQLIGFFTDISERKQMEAALMEERNLLRTVIDNLPDLIFVKDIESRFVLVNQASLQMGQQTMADIIGKTDFEINPPELAAQYYADDQAVIESGQTIIDQEEGNTSTGQLRWFSTTKVPLRNHQGQIIGLVGLSRDITERKRAEAALHESLLFNQAVLNSLTANIAVLDGRGVIIAVNNAWEQFARDNGEPTLAQIGPGVNYLEVCRQVTGPETAQAQAALAGIQAVMSGDQPHFSLEYPCHSPNEQRWFTMRVTPLHNGHENVVVAHEYITERKRAEAEISARNRELSLLNQIIAVAADSQDVEAILETACRELAHAFNIAQVTATLLNESKSAAVVAAAYSAQEDSRVEAQEQGWLAAQGTAIELKLHDPFVRYLLNQAGPLVASEVQTDARLVSMRPALQRRGIVSLLVLPLRDEANILGSLNLAAAEPHFFSAEEVALAWSAADQVAGALRRLRLEQERVQVEAEVRASEERFREVVASISDHIYLSEITAEGEHLNRYISPNVEQLTGYPLGKFINDATFWPTVVIHPDDRAIAAAQLGQLRQGENSEVEYRLVRADGPVVWVRDSGRVVPQANTVLIYGVVSNVTERKQAEMSLLQERALLAERVAERTAELSAANAQLARAAQLKDEFLANMSHELRTPLNAILGMSEILRGNIYGSLNEKQLNAVGHIEEGGRHLLMLINDILDLSKIEAGKLELFIGPVAVEDVCQASLRFIKQIAQKKQIAVSFTLDPTLTTIQADERRLKQILVNLLTNAVKFTPEGGQVKLEVEPDPLKELLCFSVHDTGIGIAPAEMKRLFKPFVQLDSKLSRQHEGTGLGLSLVSRLTELHGGGVTVESRPGQGSKFTVSLPCQAEVRPDEPTSRTQSWQAIDPMLPLQELPVSQKPLILLAEDNEANINTLLPYLEAKGYRLKLARNGRQAVEMAQEERPDVILMDIQMPVMDGLEATRQLRATPQFTHVPIIALTALAMPGDQERCLAAGATAYLSKPVSLKGLVQMIESLLERKNESIS